MQQHSDFLFEASLQSKGGKLYYRSKPTLSGSIHSFILKASTLVWFLHEAHLSFFLLHIFFFEAFQDSYCHYICYSLLQWRETSSVSFQQERLLSKPEVSEELVFAPPGLLGADLWRPLTSFSSSSPASRRSSPCSSRSFSSCWLCIRPGRKKLRGNGMCSANQRRVTST